MPGSWPEPFGLVAIEALACGTPILARRVGGLPEIIRDGVDGFFGDDVAAAAFLVDRVADLDREAIRASVLERFSAARMTDGYLEIYRTMLADAASNGSGQGATRATRVRDLPIRSTRSGNIRRPPAEPRDPLRRERPSADPHCSQDRSG